MDARGAGGRAQALRPVPGPAVPRDGGPFLGRGAPPAADDSPHRRRRVVDGADSPGSPAAVRRLHARAASNAARAADSVRRLRLLAARLVAGARARAGDRVLGKRAGGGAPRARSAHGQAPSPGAELPRRDRGLRAVAYPVGSGESAGTAGAGHAVHDARGGVRGPAAPVYRPGRPAGRDSHFRPHAQRDGTTHRVLPQHRRAAVAVQRGVDLPRAGATGARPGARRLRAPGPSLRAPRRGAGARP